MTTNKPDQKDLTMPERIAEYIKEINDALPKTLQDSLDKGVPITYTDKQGRYVKEMPNGEIIILRRPS